MNLNLNFLYMYHINHKQNKSNILQICKVSIHHQQGNHYKIYLDINIANLEFYLMFNPYFLYMYRINCCQNMFNILQISMLNIHFLQENHYKIYQDKNIKKLIFYQMIILYFLYMYHMNYYLNMFNILQINMLSINHLLKYHYKIYLDICNFNSIIYQKITPYYQYKYHKKINLNKTSILQINKPKI